MINSREFDTGLRALGYLIIHQWMKQRNFLIIIFSTIIFHTLSCYSFLKNKNQLNWSIINYFISFFTLNKYKLLSLSYVLSIYQSMYYCSLCISNFHTLVASFFLFCFNAAQNYLFHPDEIAEKNDIYWWNIKSLYRCLLYFYMYFYITPFCRQSCSNEKVFISARILCVFILVWNSFYLLLLLF